MSEKRILGLLGLILGLIAGLLLLADAFRVGRNEPIDLEFLLNRAVVVVLGLALLFGSFLLFRDSYKAGGVVNLAIGAVVLILGYGDLEGVLGIVSGVLGLVASQARA